MTILKCLVLAILLTIATSNSQAGGLLGDAIKSVGRATGIKPIEKAGQELDNAHRDIKNAVPPYKAIEEKTSEVVRESFEDLCSIPYQTITHSVIAKCSNWSGRLDDRDLIDKARNRLIDAGIFKKSEFNGIQIRWCPLNGAEGMAPDRGRIYLDTAMKGASETDLAALLAHEMTHVRQYRRMGTDSFKCTYSRKYAECGGCQDRRHPLEREAYDFEDEVYNHLFPRGWEVCNSSDEKEVFVAYGYYESRGWITKGWRKIERGECSQLISDLNSRYVYYYAEAVGGIWSGDIELCAHPNLKFEYDAENCSSDYEFLPFREVDTGESTRWTTNLTE